MKMVDLYCYHCKRKILNRKKAQFYMKFDSDHYSKRWLCKNCDKKMNDFFHKLRKNQI